MRRSLVLLPLVAALLLAPAALGSPGRIAVGVGDGVDVAEVEVAVASATGGSVSRALEPLGAFVVAVDDAEAALQAIAGVPGVEYAEPVERSRSLAFVPNDPLLGLQWYVDAIRAFEFWAIRPALGPVRVAVIDSGIEADHPEFAGRVVDSRSFVGSPPGVDTIGHGTLVAGEIAATLDNDEGIAGVGFPVQLMIAKVVDANGSISVEAEAKAIRWAVENGARVINLSLGGPRDPRNPSRDTYSALEQDAIDYAYSKGAVVVAAAGNCTTICPYPYASYPAALPHVVGVGAMTQTGGVPTFSNRDPRYNDFVAPGTGIVSTFPVDLTDSGCENPGYSVCADDEYRAGNGTSFAAPLATATVALLLAQNPGLTASQVMHILSRSVIDLIPKGRDAATGNGRLDVPSAFAALALPKPPADRYETNDDAGSSAKRLYGSRPSFNATIDWYEDPRDVYGVRLKKGTRTTIELHASGVSPTLVLWPRGTTKVGTVNRKAVRKGKVVAFRRGANSKITLRVKRSGWYYVEVRPPKRGDGSYELTIAK